MSDDLELLVEQWTREPFGGAWVRWAVDAYWIQPRQVRRTRRLQRLGLYRRKPDA